MKGMVALVVFICLILCVWRPEYTVWKTGGFILHNTGFMLQIVLLRLFLGMAGVYSVVFVMGSLYDKTSQLSVTKLFADIGKQTLAIYMMQHIVVEIGLSNLVKSMGIKGLLVEHPILMGYVVPPLISLLLLYAMYCIAKLMQESKYTKWMFGFKMSLRKWKNS